MNVLNIDTATIEQLKVASFDTAKEVARLQQQQEILMNAINQKERLLNRPVAPEVKPESTPAS